MGDKLWGLVGKGLYDRALRASVAPGTGLLLAINFEVQPGAVIAHKPVSTKLRKGSPARARSDAERRAAALG